MLQSTTLDPHSVNGMRTIATASITDPEGTTNKAKIIAADASTSFHARFLATTAGTNTTITVSIFAKKNGYKYLYFADLASGRSAVRFDLDDGTTSNSAGVGFVSASATLYPNGWWRCSMVATVVASTSYAWSYVGSPTTGATLSIYGATYNGTNTDSDGIYCYGFSVEAGSGASSYIPTGASQVTRNADICYMAISTIGFSTSGGTFFTSFYRGEANLGLNQAGSAINTDYADTRWLGIGSGYGSTTFGFGAWNGALNKTGAGVFGLNKAAGSYASWVTSTTGIFTVNGATAVTGTLSNLGTTPNYLMIGSASQSSPYNGVGLRDYLNNSIRSIKYFPTAFTAAQLQTLTAP
jgi:hypothetical protein